MSPVTILKQALQAVIEFFFGCSHSHVSRVFTLRHRSYKVCLDCGRELPYSLNTMAYAPASIAVTKSPLSPAPVLEFRPVASQPAGIKTPMAA